MMRRRHVPVTDLPSPRLSLGIPAASLRHQTNKFNFISTSNYTARRNKPATPAARSAPILFGTGSAHHRSRPSRDAPTLLPDDSPAKPEGGITRFHTRLQRQTPRTGRSKGLILRDVPGPALPTHIQEGETRHIHEICQCLRRREATSPAAPSSAAEAGAGMGLIRTPSMPM